MNTNIVDRLEKLKGLYGKGQELPDILDGLNIRLSRARELYGPERSIQTVVSGLYDKLDHIRLVYGPNRTIEDILDNLVVRQTVLNHLIKLMSKPVVTVAEAEEIQAIKRRWNEVLWRQAKEKRKERAV
jgi:hypothetical protein